MENEEKKEDLEKKDLPSESEKAEAEAKTNAKAEQDPLKNELERVQNKPQRSKVDKLLFTKKRIESQLKEELGDEYDDDEEDPINEDDRPLTIGEFKKIQKESTVQTSLNLADEIENSIERELVKHHLENTIQPSGNPKEDLKNARAIVNAIKNKQILEETARKIDAKKHSSGSSGPAKQEKNEELTADELPFTRPPFNMTKAEIISTRK